MPTEEDDAPGEFRRPPAADGDRAGYRPHFRALLASFAFANLADGLMLVTLPLMAASLSRSPLQVGLVTAALTIPWAVLAPVFGVYADRIALRGALQSGNLLRALALGLLAAALLSKLLTIPILAAGALIVGSAEVIYDISAQTALPSIVPSAMLERGNSHQAFVTEILEGLIGPALGGLLVTNGAVWSLSAGACLYLVSALAALRLPEMAAATREHSGLVSEMMFGLRTVWNDPLLRTLLAMTAFGAVAFSGWQPLFTLLATGPDHLDGFQYGLVYSVGALGGAVGSFAAPRLTQVISRAWLLIAAKTLGTICLAVPIVVRGFPIAAAALAGYSFCVVIWNVITISHRQRALPVWLLGRANASYRALSWSLLPLGPLLGGAVGSITHDTRAGMLALVSVYALAMLFFPTVARFRPQLDGHQRHSTAR